MRQVYRTSDFSTHAILFLLWVVMPLTVIGQNNDGLDKIISAYIQEENFSEQYNKLSELINFNSSLTLEEGSHYLELFSSPEYTRKDKRYPILGHLILADVFYFKEQKDSSLFHYYNVINLAKESNYNMLTSSGVGNASLILSEFGDKIGAINLLKQHKRINANTGDIRDIADHTYNIASYYRDIGMPDSAIYYFEKTLEVDTESNNKRGMIYDMHVLISNYIKHGKYEKAVKLCHECISISQEIKDKSAEARCYFYQADTHIQVKDLEKAEQSILKAIRIDSSRNDVIRFSQYYKIYASILTLKGDVKNAEVNFLQALEYAKLNKSKTDLVSSSLAYAKFLMDLGQHKKAHSYLIQAEELIEKHNLKNYNSKLFSIFTRYHVSQGNYKRALFYKEKEAEYLIENNSLNVLQSNDQGKNVLDLYNMELENKTLSSDKALAVEKANRRKILLTFISLMSLLLIGLAYLLYQNQRKKNLLFKQKAEEEKIVLNYQVLEKEMEALRAQMNPHFLFNSLSSVNDYIMHEEPRLASKYLTKFSQLMRTILNNSKEKLISLNDELKAIKLYVEMENLRFAEHFAYHEIIDDNINLNNSFIPPMLIQPYVENSIKHGLRSKKEKGNLTISVSKVSNNLVIRIEDDGIGRIESIKNRANDNIERKSHGMEITQNRIDLLNRIYNVDATIQIIDKVSPSGTEVILRIKLIDKLT